MNDTVKNEKTSLSMAERFLVKLLSKTYKELLKFNLIKNRSKPWLGVFLGWNVVPYTKKKKNAGSIFW